MRDCNECNQLNITEDEQDALWGKGISEDHYCLKYNKRVFHRTRARVHDPKIYPCSECMDAR